MLLRLAQRNTGDDTVAKTHKPRSLRKRNIGCLVRQVQYMLVLLCVGLLALGALEVRQRGSVGALLLRPTLTPTVEPTTPEFATLPEPAITAVPAAPTATPALAATAYTTEPCCHVGILAGHSGPQNDPGAMCDDGLKEADINLRVAQAVVDALTRRGYRVDLLEEFDPRLDAYRADVFLSIHSDSCQVAEASGFKVARVLASAIPNIEDLFVDCLYQEYQQATGLQRHDLSITPNMHQYYAFSKIDPQTPGAIIELGFLGADRDLLVNGERRMVDGIVSGITCFLEQRAGAAGVN